METTSMVKPDKSCATKTGHFYLSLTVVVFGYDAGSPRLLIIVRELKIRVRGISL